MRAPKGVYPSATPYIRLARESGFIATGEFRPPTRGEWYLSGAIIHAYEAPNALTTPYWIAKLVKVVKCTACDGHGKLSEDGRKLGK